MTKKSQQQQLRQGKRLAKTKQTDIFASICKHDKASWRGKNDNANANNNERRMYTFMRRGKDLNGARIAHNKTPTISHVQNANVIRKKILYAHIFDRVKVTIWQISIENNIGKQMANECGKHGSQTKRFGSMTLWHRWAVEWVPRRRNAITNSTNVLESERKQNTKRSQFSHHSQVSIYRMGQMRRTRDREREGRGTRWRFICAQPNDYLRFSLAAAFFQLATQIAFGRLTQRRREAKDSAACYD